MRRTTASLTGPVGTAFTIDDGSGNMMSVTLTQVINPAPGSDQECRLRGAKHCQARVNSVEPQ
jgi:hypothetical protein